MTIPYARTELVNLFHREGQVGEIDFGEEGTTISGQLPPRLLDRFRPYVTMAGPQPLGSRTAAAS